MKVSARNTVTGTVTEIKRGAVATQVSVDIGGGNQLTSTITVDAADDLGLAVGKSVTLIIKASDVIVAVD